MDILYGVAVTSFKATDMLELSYFLDDGAPHLAGNAAQHTTYTMQIIRYIGI